MLTIPRFLQLCALNGLGLFVATSASLLAQAPEEEEEIQIQFRTYGWGEYHKALYLPDSEESFAVFHSNFSQPLSYRGQPTMLFYKSSTAEADFEKEMDQYMVSLTGEESDNTETSAPKPPKPAVKKAPLAPFASVRIPEGMKKVLLIFAPPRGAKGQRVFPVDDSLTELNTRNVHFYNLSPVELVVKTMDVVKIVPARQQVIWKLKPEQSASPIAIAVTDPEKKVIYSSRYRIRDNERLVFFAQLSEIDNEGIPRINVKGQQLPITESKENAAALVEDVELR